MAQKIKTPAELPQAGAKVWVERRMDRATFKGDYNPTAKNGKAPAKKQPEARAKFSEIQSTREVSLKGRLSPGVAGATARNAWLPIEVLRG